MVKRFLISCGIAFAALAAKATPDDSIKVVKGQVSDYYITVTQDRIVKGHVLDTNRQPLAGATQEKPLARARSFERIISCYIIADTAATASTTRPRTMR